MAPRALIACAIAILMEGPGRGMQSAPLPDSKTFFSEVGKRLASNTLIQSRFTYRERVVDVKTNPFGDIGTQPPEVYEVYPFPDEDMTYRRLVERNGAPIARAVIEEQDREFLARYHAWRQKLAREGQSERQARLKAQEDARARDRERAQEALRLFDFTIERRDQHLGEPAIVVSFRPKPTARPESREARVASSFAGNAWIHEQEYEVMRVESEAVRDTAFGFGILARLYKGATAVFIRKRVGQVWLPTESRVTGSGSALLFRKAEFKYSREYSDYRPFDPARFVEMLGSRD